MTPERYIGTFILLVAAGNETTRNSLSGGFLALADHPAQKRRLVADPSLLGSAASEIVRWVSPVMHMRRTAIEPAQIADQSIRPGDKIILWYCSGIVTKRSSPIQIEYLAEKSGKFWPQEPREKAEVNILGPSSDFRSLTGTFALEGRFGLISSESTPETALLKGLSERKRKRHKP